VEELEHRARYGGVLDGVPALTGAEWAAWERIEQARSTWVPFAALRYAWARACPIHGRGGRYRMGRPIRPTDPDYGDGWQHARFLAALRRDAAEIDAVIAAQPEQSVRLRDWLREMEDVGRVREARPEEGASLHTRLIELGYSGCDRRSHQGDDDV
jgi:hypothetical protein